MKPTSATDQGKRRWIRSAMRGLSNSLFAGHRSPISAKPQWGPMDPSLGESLLDNIEGDFGYVAAVEEVEELLFQTELQANGRGLFVSRGRDA